VLLVDQELCTLLEHLSSPFYEGCYFWIKNYVPFWST
jgi:hypothetical protein